MDMIKGVEKALVAGAVGLLATYGVEVSGETEQLITALVSAALVYLVPNSKKKKSS